MEEKMSFAEDGEQPGATATATPGSETPGAPSELGDETPTTEVKLAEEVQEEAPESPEEAEPLVADQPPAPLPEGWQDHPDTKTVFDAHFNNGRGQRERELRTEMERREERYGTEVQDAYRQGAAAEVVTKFVETLEESIGLDLDTPEGAKALGKVLRGHREWAEVFTNTSAQGVETQFARAVKSVVREAGLPEEAVGELSDTEGELSWKVRHGEMKLVDGVRELIKASFKHIKALGAQEEKERRDKMEREMKDAGGRVRNRQEQPPPTAPSGSGAGGASKKRKDLSADERAKQTPAQIDAETAQFVKDNP